MEPFLKRLASALIEDHSEELGSIAVVLPGRRAGLYLRKYLAQALGKTFWSPEMLDVGGFMERMSGMRQGGSMEMLFLLYRIYCEVAGAKAGTLEEFLQWAPTTLRDMSEVDGHLLDLDNLYRDLRSYHEIEEWSFRMDPLSHGQQHQVQLWRTTGELHRRLHEAMLEGGYGTSGFLARKAAEGLGNGSLECPWSMVWFAGLNALEPATTEVIRQIQKKGRAELAWDADPYYLDDPKQEAGHFLRRSIKALGPGRTPPIDAIRTLRRHFHMISVPDQTSQAKAAAQFLAASDPLELAGTAVVLAEEDLLMPLLEALPGDIGPINITMGMPLVSLPVHGLTEAFLEMHVRTDKDGAFRAQNVERLLLHPFLHQGAATDVALKTIREGERYFLGPASIVKAANSGGMDHEPWSSLVFSPLVPGLSDLPEKLGALLGWARHLTATDRFTQEQLFRMARLQQRLHRELERSSIPALDLRTYVPLRAKLLREERITSFGEPLRGPQIMGFLETRAIDHDRVIILGAQEGSLPRTSTDQSWIPFPIRKVKGLPLPFDTASVTAYHFYRCTQLAKDVHALHGASGDTGPGEPSRYVTQWMHEIVGTTNTTGTESTLLAPTVPRNAAPIEVLKTAAVLARLNEIASKGFSPSALGMYLRCPLDFWLTRGSGIGSDQELSERLGSDVLGEAVHRVLEHIHRPCLDRELDPAMLRDAAGEVRSLLTAELGRTFPLTVLEKGHFRLKMEMASEAMKVHLLAEAERCEDMVSIVRAVEVDLDLVLPSGAKLRGRIDRVEERDGIIHVLDMKTGKVKEELLRLPSLERDDLKPEKDKALQLLIYSALYLGAHPELGMVRAGIIPLQRPSSSDGLLLSIKGESDIHRQMLPGINALIDTLVGEIMDPERSFEHRAQSLWCESCIN